MTREEAIKFLTLMRKAVSNFEEYGYDRASMVIECDKAEAIDMAIEALSTNPKEEFESADAFSLTETMKYLTKPHNYCEVVRCKDCVYCEPYAVDTGEDCMTGLWCGKNQKDITLQDFCSYGERRDE